MKRVKISKAIFHPKTLFQACLFVFFCLTMLNTLACEKKKPGAQSPPVVTVMDVIQRDMPVTFEYIAQTQSSHLVNIHARVSGFLDKRLYTEGAVVKEGQTLFQMDAKPFQVQLDQARAALAGHEAALETARLNLALFLYGFSDHTGKIGRPGNRQQRAQHHKDNDGGFNQSSPFILRYQAHQPGYNNNCGKG